MTESKASEELRANCRECWKHDHLPCEQCATHVALKALRCIRILRGTYKDIPFLWVSAKDVSDHIEEYMSDEFNNN